MGNLDLAAGLIPKVDADLDGSSLESLKQANLELKEQNRRLLELKEHRSSLISHLAHELRTPLTSILGFSEILLSQEELTAAQRNFCERIQNSAHQLQRSLNQLTELSRLEVAFSNKPSEESSDE